MVLKKAYNQDVIAERVNGQMVDFANRGLRSLGLALAEGDGADGTGEYHMLCLLPLFDPPRVDTKATIEYCHKQVRRWPAWPGAWGGQPACTGEFAAASQSFLHGL